MRFKIFVLFICIIVAYLSACGLYSSTESVFSSNNNRTGNAGDGDIPRLSERSKSRPDLEDQDCEDRDACRRVCDAMYADADSEEECVELTYGKVGDLEEVYLALRNGERENADPSLEDIDLDDLEEYLDIGWDGWLDVIIPTQVRNEDYDKIWNTLRWIAEDSGAANTLKNIRRDTNYEHNGILRGLFINYCDPDSSGVCSNNDVSNTIAANAHGNINFDFNMGYLVHNSVNIASITESRKKELFVALSVVEGDWNFFNSVAGNTRTEDALELAHELLEVACETSAGTGSTKFEQCIRGFYCWLNAQFSSNPILSSDFAEVEMSLNNIDISSCSTFTGI